MVTFEAGAVIGMLAIVETTVAALGWYIARRVPTEEAVDEVEDTANEAAKEAAAAAREASEARRRSEQAHDRINATSSHS
ncbi:hypothetical protein BRC97_07075 [Halobacteriales archaeon QS_6_71_20]|nr:MAG: hypothetical protein BRC97_07075 [Halobacteriales archaeon QS_6_71_20]